MGKEIVYCVNCGERLTEGDFERGKAQLHDGKPYCGRCRTVTAPPPPPPSRPAGERMTERRVATTARRKSPTGWVPRVAPPGESTPRRATAASAPGATKDSKTAVIAGVIAGLIIVLIVAAVTMGGKGSTPPDRDASARADARAAAAAAEELEQRLRELESLAAATTDPQAVLVRCDQLRASFRGTPLETRFKAVEFRAFERQKERERSDELDRSLAAVRRIMQEDPDGVRRVEVENLLEAALKKAGPRAADVEKLQKEYRSQCEETAKRREAQKPPAPPLPPQAPAARTWIDCFTQATAKIQANDYAGAKTIYLEGLATLPETRPEEIVQRALYCTGLYNLACIYAVESPKLGDAARRESLGNAFKFLERALQGDYGRFRCPCHPQTAGLGHMADDKDMEPLRADPRYAELLKKYK